MTEKAARPTQYRDLPSKARSTSDSDQVTTKITADRKHHCRLPTSKTDGSRDLPRDGVHRIDPPDNRKQRRYKTGL